MSNIQNDLLMEAAVALADEVNARFEDPTYSDMVAKCIRTSDLEMLDGIVRHMRMMIHRADINDLPEITVW